VPTAAKSEAIEQAKEWYQRSKGVVFTDYRGLKVRDMQALRANLRSKGGELHVIKNTLFRLAAGSDTDLLPSEFHNGPTAIAFFFENETECAKVLFDYAKANKSFEVKGGFIAGKAFSTAQVESLSKLPSKEVLIAQVIGTIAAPLSNLVGVIEALYAEPIRVIGAVADKVAKESGEVPVAAISPAEAPPEPEVADEQTPAEAASADAVTAQTEADSTIEEPTTDEPVEGSATNEEAVSADSESQEEAPSEPEEAKE